MVCPIIKLSHFYRFSQSSSDHSLFTKRTNSSFTVILVYVDDLFLAGNDITQITTIKDYLHKSFKIKDLGYLKYLKFYLNVVYLLQNPINSYDKRNQTGKRQRHPLDNLETYKRSMGMVIYLTTTRLDISYVVQQLSQFMTTPTLDHHVAAIHVLHYIKQGPSLGIFFPANTHPQLKAFNDSNWASCHDTRRSVIEFCIFMGDSLISWKFKKQAIVS